MSESKVRIGGSGYTVMSWRDQRLAYLQTLQDTPPQPVAQAQAVQPIDAPEPLEIVTAQAVGPGTLKMTFYELWNTPVWAGLPGLEGTNNLLEVLRRQVEMDEITCRKIIKVPGTVGQYRTYAYRGCKIVDIDQGEQINIGTMTLPKTITLQYTSMNLV